MRQSRGRLVLVAVLLATMVAAALPTGAQDVVTNEAIVSMVKAGLPESVILAKIRSGPTKFDTGPDALVSLKKAGVSDKILEAMVAGAAPAAAAAAKPAAASTLRDRDAIYHVTAAGPVELRATVGGIETSFGYFDNKGELVLPGRKAALRLTERQPVFLSAYSEGEATLVRLKPGSSKDDRNLKVAGGGPFSFKEGIRSEDRIAVSVEKDKSGLLRVTPRDPLAAGEYGFAVLNQKKIFDFGVD